MLNPTINSTNFSGNCVVKYKVFTVEGGIRNIVTV